MIALGPHNLGLQILHQTWFPAHISSRLNPLIFFLALAIAQHHKLMTFPSGIPSTMGHRWPRLLMGLSKTKLCEDCNRYRLLKWTEIQCIWQEVKAVRETGYHQVFLEIIPCINALERSEKEKLLLYLKEVVKQANNNNEITSAQSWKEAIKIIMKLLENKSDSQPVGLNPFGYILEFLHISYLHYNFIMGEITVIK